MSGKNKLVPRLLGVTKDSIVRVDERTKDVRVFNYDELLFSVV
jgi:talin